MTTYFADRADAGRHLAHALGDIAATRPVILAIPRGGVEVGAVIAEELATDLDVVLTRKLRAPFQPELAIGAVSENGDVYLTDDAWTLPGVTSAAIDEERAHQVSEIGRRRAMYRAACPPARLTGRDVVVTDDGIATGSTMIAALRTVRGSGASHVTVAVPVAAPDRLDMIRPLCDRLLCLHAPPSFRAVGQFYESFDTVEDDRVVELLRAACRRRTTSEPRDPPRSLP